MPQISTSRRSIVVIDDEPQILEVYARKFVEYNGDRFFYHFFDNSAQALEFVSRSNADVLGYIQDIMRGDGRGRLINEGIAFFNNVIEHFTPDARCVFVSAYGGDSNLLSELVDHATTKFLFVSKAKLRHPDDFHHFLDWLVAPYAPNFEKTERKVADIARIIAPAWSEIYREIIGNEKLLHTMDTRLFEQLAGEIFRSYGWEIELTARTRDGGYDVMAIRKLGPTALKVLIEAKRFNPRRPVGVDLVRSLYGVKQSKAASQLVLVTSSFVTLDAKKEFSRVVPWELDFFERDKILEWCRQQSGMNIGGEFN